MNLIQEIKDKKGVFMLNFDLVLAVCSEACVNVIEVQLAEERAKVEALKLQLQRVQVGIKNQF